MLYFTQADLLIKHDNALFKRLSKAEDEIRRFKVYLNTPIEGLNNRALTSDYDFLFEINKILSTIISITNKPHITIQDRDIILRSSLVTEFNNEKFNDTLRESELWRLKGGKFTPEFSHTSEYLDNYRTYENILVIMCFRLIERVIERVSVHYQNYTSDLSSAFAFDNYSVTSLFNANNSRLIDKTLVSRDDVDKLLTRLRFIRRKIHLIKLSYFYNELKNVNPIMTKIVSTNILKFNRRYQQVFYFYNELLKNSNSVEVTKANRNYYISLLIKAVNYYFELTNKKQVLNEKGFNLKFANERFSLSLLTKNTKTFLIKIKANERKSINTVSSLTIVNDFSEYRSVPEVSAYEYVLVGEQLFRYINTRFVPLKYHYSQGDLALINTLISSLIVSVDIEPTHKITSCPICGNDTMNIKHKYDVTCLNCGSQHALINADSDKAFMWIKKVYLEVE